MKVKLLSFPLHGLQGCLVFSSTIIVICQAMLKTCRSCSESKPLDEFYKEPRVKDGRTARCKKCTKEHSGQSYGCNKEAVKSRLRKNYCPKKGREQKLKRNYGLCTEVFEHMLKLQNYKCKICGSEDPKHNSGQFVVDHCHESGQVRGLLCSECNLMLGKVHDNTTILQNAINYLQQ